MEPAAFATLCHLFFFNSILSTLNFRASLTVRAAGVYSIYQVALESIWRMCHGLSSASRSVIREYSFNQLLGIN